MRWRRVPCRDGAAVNVAGQSTGPRASPLTIDSMYGADLFQFYCAACRRLVKLPKSTNGKPKSVEIKVA